MLLRPVLHNALGNSRRQLGAGWAGVSRVVGFDGGQVDGDTTGQPAAQFQERYDRVLRFPAR
jgi:hypothetical protein